MVFTFCQDYATKLLHSPTFTKLFETQTWFTRAFPPNTSSLWEQISGFQVQGHLQAVKSLHPPDSAGMGYKNSTISLAHTLTNMHTDTRSLTNASCWQPTTPNPSSSWLPEPSGFQSVDVYVPRDSDAAVLRAQVQVCDCMCVRACVCFWII